MRISFCNFHESLNRDDFMFRHLDTGIGDELLRPMLELKAYANSQGIEVGTVSVLPVTSADAVVFIDMPEEDNLYFQQALATGKPLYLIELESRLVRPDAVDPARIAPFRKIFTYDDRFVDNKRFIKINYSFKFHIPKLRDDYETRKFCTLIAGNKRGTGPLELYSERIAAIRWFEKNHPEEFDLYGAGWDEFQFPELPLLKSLNHLKALRKLIAPTFPSWRGAVERKRQVLEQYRFVLCYENIRDIPGYITEKLFDVFFSGGVPIYRGANNVEDHIPSECFIDRRLFKSYEELYICLKEMSAETYEGYRSAIRNFLSSDAARPFECSHFAETIIRELVR